MLRTGAAVRTGAGRTREEGFGRFRVVLSVLADPVLADRSGGFIGRFRVVLSVRTGRAGGVCDLFGAGS